MIRREDQARKVKIDDEEVSLNLDDKQNMVGFSFFE